jgi:CRP-like cAMP-binding protein
MPLTGNLLLDTLSPATRNSILTYARASDLPRKTILFNESELPPGLFFLTSGVASLVIHAPDAQTCEVGMVGREGLIGASTLLGPALPIAQCVMQMGGNGLRVPRRTLQLLFSESAEFRDTLLAMVQREKCVSSQLSACNLRHQAEARVARWLLTASDLGGSSTLQIKQEALGEMVGIRRTTVSLMVQPMRTRGLIHVSRGTIRILDREGIQALACDCYSICRKLMQHGTFPDEETSQLYRSRLHAA